MSPWSPRSKLRHWEDPLFSPKTNYTTPGPSVACELHSPKGLSGAFSPVSLCGSCSRTRPSRGLSSSLDHGLVRTPLGGPVSWRPTLLLLPTSMANACKDPCLPTTPAIMSLGSSGPLSPALVLPSPGPSGRLLGKLRGAPPTPHPCGPVAQCTTSTGSLSAHVHDPVDAMP